MANKTKTISILFDGDPRINKVIDSVEGKLGGLKDHFESTTQPLADLAKKAEMAEGALIGLAATGIALAIREAGKFNDSFKEISTLTNATGVDIDKFRGLILTYAGDSRKTIEDLNKAIYAAISAGVDYSKSVSFVNDAEKLSIAGRADLVDTTKVLVGTLNAYGETTDKASKYSDVFFQIVKSGQTTLPELSQSIAQVTGIAANAGIPFSTLGAAIAALTAAGMPTSQAITSIKAAIENIIKPTGEAEKQAETLGIKFNAAQLKAKGFEGVLSEVYKATGGNIEKMGQLFGSVEGLNGAMVLAADKSGKFKATLEDMKGATGSTAEAYGKMADSLELVNVQLLNNIRIAAIKIGSELEGTFKDIEGSLSHVFKSISQGVDEGSFDPVFDMIKSFGSKVTKYLDEIAKNMPESFKGLDWSDFVRSFEELGTAAEKAFTALFGKVDLTTVDGLQKALQRVINAVTTLNQVVTGIIEGGTPLLAKIGMVIEKAEGGSEAAKKFAGEILGMGQAINSLIGVLGLVEGPLKAGGAAFQLLAGLIVFTSAGGWGKIIEGATGAAGSVAGLASISGLLTVSGVAAAGAIGVGAGILANEYIPGIKQAAEKLVNLVTGWGDVAKANELASQKANEQADKIRELNGLVSEFPGEIGVEYQNRTSSADMDFYQLMMSNESIQKAIKLAADNQATEDWLNTLRKDKPDFSFNLHMGTDPETGKSIQILEEVQKPVYKTIEIQTKLNEEEARKEAKKLEESLVFKKIEIQADIDITKIKTQSEEVQKLIEWKGKIDIANIEADAKKVVAQFDSIKEGITSTGNLLGSLFAELGGATGIGKFSIITDAIMREQELREKEFELQEQLIKEQIELTKLKNQAISRGEALIKVTADGLQPELEAFMWKILERVQMRVAESNAEFLLGIKST